jgi:uncharacterized protein
VRIPVKVIPKSSRSRIAGWTGGALKVCVTAAPERGKANDAIIQLLAGALGLPPRGVRIVVGASSARKIIEVDGLDEQEIRRRLVLKA